MKASKFSDAQKAFIIKQGDEGTPVAEICRKAGISQATSFNWKKKYAGLLPTEMKRLCATATAAKTWLRRSIRCAVSPAAYHCDVPCPRFAPSQQSVSRASAA